MPKPKRPIPLYVERAMLRLTRDPELVRTVGRLMPVAAFEVGTRLHNADQENRAESNRKAAKRERNHAS